MRGRRDGPVPIKLAMGLAQRALGLSVAGFHARIRYEDLEDVVSEAYYLYLKKGAETGQWDAICLKRRLIDVARSRLWNGRKHTRGCANRTPKARRGVFPCFADFPMGRTREGWGSRGNDPETYLDRCADTPAPSHGIDVEDMIELCARTDADAARMRTILRMMVDGWTMKEAGAVFSLSESRVSQLIKRLRSDLLERGIFTAKQVAGRSPHRVARPRRTWRPELASAAGSG